MLNWTKSKRDIHTQTGITCHKSERDTTNFGRKQWNDEGKKKKNKRIYSTQHRPAKHWNEIKWNKITQTCYVEH